MGTELKPRADAWGEEDLFSFPESPCREELIDGVMIVNPPPANPHQWVSSELWLALRSSAPPGFTVLEAAGVRLPDGSLLIPDLIVVARPKAETLGMTVNAAADIALAIEIVSPGSHTLDRVTKPTLYAQAGIPNFWRVEVDRRILLYRLAGDAYAEVAAVHPGQPLTADEPFPMALDPALLAE